MKSDLARLAMALSVRIPPEAWDALIPHSGRLRARLARSRSALGQGLLTLLSRGHLDDQAWEEVEETLLAADLGVEATTTLVETLRRRVVTALRSSLSPSAQRRSAVSSPCMILAAQTRTAW
mgnify:CR=1 FL=1